MITFKLLIILQDQLTILSNKSLIYKDYRLILRNNDLINYYQFTLEEPKTFLYLTLLVAFCLRQTLQSLYRFRPS